MRLSVGKLSKDGTFSVTLHLKTTEKTGRVRLEQAFDDARKPLIARAEGLAAALEGQCPDLVRSLARAHPTAGRLVLEIEEPRLYDVPWESAFHRLLHGKPHWSCVRAVPGAVPRPPSLPPYRVLWADVADPAGGGRTPHAPRELRHYASVVAEEATASSLGDLTSQERFEVVHLAGIEALKGGGRGRLELGGSPQTLTPAQLRTLVGKPPKLLVLEAARGNKSTLIDFAHRFAERTGSAVLVSEPADPEAARTLAKTVYLGIARDQSLDEIVAQLAASPELDEPPVLVAPPGGEEVLRLDRPEGAVKSWYRNLQAQAAQESGLLSEVKAAAKKRGAGRSYLKLLGRYEKHLRQAGGLLEKKKLTLYDLAEGRGIEPMGEAVESAAAAAATIDRVAAVTRRVVNTCFTWRRRPVPKERDLVCGREYRLQVQIGALSPDSNNRSPRGVPEEDLERYMSKEGVELRAVVQSRHFQVLESEKPLWLPPRPLESEPQTFRVVAPAAAGPGELLLLLYFRSNLLQAIRIWAQVTPRGAGTEPKGNYAETEFALESLTEKIEQLPARDAQLYVSVGKNPTHTLTVEGTGDRQPLELSDGKLRKALGQARSRLLQLAEGYYIQRGGRRISTDELLDDLRILAQTGFGFFDTLLPKVQREALATKVAGHRNLQVAHSRSLEQIYPWALVYDHPLFVVNPRLCPEVEQLLNQRGATVDALEQLDCMVNGCRHRGETDTICPSGFWGFRHTIELPLSLPSEDGDDNGTPSAPVGDSGMTRTIQPGPEVRLCMGAWRDFKRLTKHSRELGRIVNLHVDGPEYEKGPLVQALQQGNQHVIYFFCHGDHNPAVSPPTVLRLGWKDHEEYVYGTDMPYLVHLQSQRPLVFVNGCHTLETDPDELVSFNRKLSEGGAAAVIGTEIKVPEDLAAPAGENLLAHLVGGTPLGEAMRRFRLSLLLERNVLGLAYTTFGFSELTLDVG